MKLLIVCFTCLIIGIMGYSGLQGDSNIKLAGGKKFAEMLIVKITKNGIVAKDIKLINKFKLII